MKLYLSGLFLLITCAAFAQTATDSLKIKNPYPPDYQYMNPESVLGIWESADSAKWRIEFLFDEDRFILALDTTLSGRHQFNSYEFFRKDSLTVSTTGVIIKWPPDHCDVKLLDANNIEIQYGYATSAETSAIKYKRVDVKK